MNIYAFIVRISAMELGRCLLQPAAKGVKRFKTIPQTFVDQIELRDAGNVQVTKLYEVTTAKNIPAITTGFFIFSGLLTLFFRVGDMKRLCHKVLWLNSARKC